MTVTCRNVPWEAPTPSNAYRGTGHVLGTTFNTTFQLSFTVIHLLLVTLAGYCEGFKYRLNSYKLSRVSNFQSRRYWCVSCPIIEIAFHYGSPDGAGVKEGTELRTIRLCEGSSTFMATSGSITRTRYFILG